MRIVKIFLFVSIASITSFSFATTEKGKVIGGTGEGSSHNKYAIEEAESNMYRNAFEYCGDYTPVRIDKISYADVGYISHAYSTFICK